MSDPHEIPTSRLIFEGANAANQAQAILLGLWASKEEPAADATVALLKVARMVQCVAEELDCRRRGAGAVRRHD